MKWNNWRKNKEPYVKTKRREFTRADRPDNWTVLCWYQHLEDECSINLTNLDAGGFAKVYVPLSSKRESLTPEQRRFVNELKLVSNYVRWYNTHYFTHDADAVQFKLMAA